ncbi:adenylate/guanylate cyclase domain-containing protein [Planctomycetota bacterium]
MSSKMDGRFYALLLRYSQEPDRPERDGVEKVLWDEFGTQKTVMVMDMSGFSLLTQKHGIVHYLSMVRRMQITSEPIIESYRGQVVKFEADNCFAMFADALGAVQAAIALNHAFDAANVLTPDELDIRISCGIDQGKILVVDEKDYFGHAVNRASKLGEDTASPGEILVTKTVADAIPEEAAISMDPISLTISGIEIEGCSVKYLKQTE